MHPEALTPQIEAVVGETVERQMLHHVPELIRRAMLPPYLTMEGLQDLTGWSERQIHYKKAERKISFVKRGRLILFPTKEILEYLDEGRIPAKKAA